MLEHQLLRPYFTPEHDALRAAAEEYFDPSRFGSWDREPGGFLKRSQWLELGKEGFLGVSLPRKKGGRGLGLLGALILNEAMSRLDDLGLSLGMHCQNEITANWLATAHDDSLGKKYLPEMIAGRLVGCACDTEPRGDSISSSATREGGELVINSRKLYVVNGYHADLCFVTLELDGEAATVLVEKDRPGVRVVRVFDKLGTRSIDSAMLEFDQVRVPAGHLALHRGVRHSMLWNKVMTMARFLMCADAFFMHRNLLEKILAYGKKRMIGDKPLAEWQIQRHALARAKADNTLMLAGLIDRFQRLERKHNVVAEVAALKSFCVDRTASLAARCCEMHGGAGYMHDSEFLIAYRQILGLKMAGGSSTTMKAIADQGFAYQEELDAIAV